MSETLWQLPTSKEVQPMLAGRLVGALLAALLITFIAPAGIGKLAACVSLLVAGVGLAVATRKITSTTVSVMHLWFGLSLEVVVSAVLPEMWPVAAIFAAATITAGYLSRPNNKSLAIGFAGSVIMGAIGAFYGVDNWLAASVVLFACGPVARSTHAWFQTMSSQRREALKSLASEGHAIVWEQTNGAFQTVAGATQTLLGVDVAEWAKQNHLSHVHPEDRQGFRSVDPSSTTGVWQGRIRTDSGDWRHVSESFEVVNKAGVTTMRGHTFDVHELVESQHRETIQARTDDATGLANRRYFLEQLDALDSDEDVSVNVALVELVGLQKLERLYGVDIAEQFLRVIGQRFQKMGDLEALARFDGRTFALATTTRNEDLTVLATNVLDRMNAPVQVKDLSFKIDTAVGVAHGEINGNELRSLVADAETALVSAVTNPERWALAKPVDKAEIAEKVRLAQDVKQGLDTGQLELWFQEKVDLTEGQIIGFEGLVRWNHPGYDQPLSPYKFLDVIEVSGHTEQFDRYVIAQAIEFAATCHHNGNDPIKVSVNVPGRALNASFVDYVTATAEIWNVEPSRIVLELTEDPTELKQERIIPTLKQLRERGFGISIDDFGTGESTFVRLLNLPVSEIKIDRSFVTGLATPPNGVENKARDLEMIVSTTIDIAKKFRLNCVAEGVEDQETVDRLIELGCTEAQGYLFSKPIPAADALKRLQITAPTATSTG